MNVEHARRRLNLLVDDLSFIGSVEVKDEGNGRLRLNVMRQNASADDQRELVDELDVMLIKAGWKELDRDETDAMTTWLVEIGNAPLT
jgi:hypothetical protein